MAKKKSKKKIETQMMQVKLAQLLSESDKHFKDLVSYLEEKIEDLNSSRDGILLKLTVPKTLSTRDLRSLLKKYLYTAGLGEKFRPIALQADEKGFEIFKKPVFE
ncbi:MAG: hypothetical protein EU530_04890 [Promethearchaeota archaeon]|nr:MAG: hypothetical protein EU530_04890 [Candidatus Lokiarchaeota archaeon]